MKKRNMNRSKELLRKRRKFIQNYIEQHGNNKQMKVIIEELVDRLFISPTTIYNALRGD